MKTKSDLQDQQCLRKELELELQHLSTDRYDMLEDRKNSKDLESQLADIKINLNSCEKRLKQSETLSERLTKENKMLKVRVQDFTKIQTENTNLTLRLNEIKSRGNDSSSSSTNNGNINGGKTDTDMIELSKKRLNSLVTNAYRLEDSLKASRNHGMTQFMTINLRHKWIMELMMIKGSLASLMNMAKRSYEHVFRELSLETVDFNSIAWDPIVGLQQVHMHTNLYLYIHIYARLNIYIYIYNILGVLDAAQEDKLVLMSIDEQLRSLKGPIRWRCLGNLPLRMAASREKVLPLYGTSSPLPTTLHWTYSGDACECIALQARYSCPYVDKITNYLPREK